MHRLPFSKSQFVATHPFELVHSDVWDPAPTQSVNGFCYYVLFVDHYTRFTWLYLLKDKSDVFPTFTHLRLWLRPNSPLKFKSLDLMGVVNTPLVLLRIFTS